MSLNVNLNGNSSGFQQMLNEAKQHANKFAGEVAKDVGGSWTGGIGRAMIGGITGFLGFEAVKGFLGHLLDTAKGIRETAEAADMSAESVQKWGKALEKAGLNMQTFQRAQDFLRGKRMEAREDASKGADFMNAGLLDEARDSSVSDEQMIRQINKLPRGQRMQLLGKSGARLAAAEKFLDSEDVDFSDSDLKDAHKLQMLWDAAVNEVEHGAVTFIGMVRDLVSKDFWTKGTVTEPRESPEQENAKRAERDADAQQAREEQAIIDKGTAARTEGHKRLIEDTEFAKQVEAANVGLRAAERGNMTIGQRRDSLRAELQALKDKEAATAGLLANGGLTEAEKADPLLTDAEKRKLVRERELSMITDRAKAAGLVGDLREKPFEHHANSLAKVGLYTGSALNFNPQMIQQQQLTKLSAIHATLLRIASKPDPHAL